RVADRRPALMARRMVDLLTPVASAAVARLYAMVAASLANWRSQGCAQMVDGRLKFGTMCTTREGSDWTSIWAACRNAPRRIWAPRSNVALPVLMWRGCSRAGGNPYRQPTSLLIQT